MRPGARELFQVIYGDSDHLIRQVPPQDTMPYCMFTFDGYEIFDRYICFYNHERIQLKTGVVQLTLHHSAIL